jgi:hypothetical protein
MVLALQVPTALTGTQQQAGAAVRAEELFTEKSSDIHMMATHMKLRKGVLPRLVLVATRLSSRWRHLLYMPRRDCPSEGSFPFPARLPLLLTSGKKVLVILTASWLKDWSYALAQGWQKSCGHTWPQA